MNEEKRAQQEERHQQRLRASGIEEVRISFAQSSLRAIIGKLEEALSPSVPFSGDYEQMGREAANKAAQSVREALGLLKADLPEGFRERW